MNNRFLLHGVTALGCALALQTASTAAVEETPAAIIGPEITAHGIGTHVAAYFNPKEYTLTKATPWTQHRAPAADAPTLEFTSGEPYHWQFEL